MDHSYYDESLELRVLRRMSYIRNKQANTKLKSLGEVNILPRSVQRVLDSGISGTHRGVEILRKVDEMCVKAINCRDAAGYKSFSPFQKHALCIIFKGKIDAVFGRFQTLLAVDGIESILDSYGFKEIPDIIGDDVKERMKNGERLALYKHFTYIQTGRQLGKSIITHIVACVFLTCFPSSYILSTSYRETLNGQNMSFIRDILEKQKHPMDTSSNKQLRLFDNRSILAMKPRGSCRGTPPSDIIIDEAAFMGNDRFYQLQVAPMLKFDRTMLLTTTPNANDDAFNRWVNSKETRSTFNMIIIEKICAKHKKEGQDVCPCSSQYEIDEYIPMDVIRAQRTFYADDPQALKQEIYGIAVPKDLPGFTAADVESFIRQPISGHLKPRKNMVFVIYDPSAHNVSGSMFTAAIYDENTRSVVIISLDYKIFDIVADIEPGLMTIVHNMIKKIAGMFPGCAIVTALEANYSTAHAFVVAGWFDKACDTFGLTCVHTKHKVKGKDGSTYEPGFMTTNHVKTIGYFYLFKWIKQRRIKMYSRFINEEVTRCRGAEKEKECRRRMLETAGIQLRNLKITQKNAIFIISGKDSGNDDIAIGLIILMYKMNVNNFGFEASPFDHKSIEEHSEREERAHISKQKEKDREPKEEQPKTKRPKRAGSAFSRFTGNSSGYRPVSFN